eukprot:7172569-Lingulodinium_polyedra.AAC.1
MAGNGAQRNWKQTRAANANLRGRNFDRYGRRPALLPCAPAPNPVNAQCKRRALLCCHSACPRPLSMPSCH